MKMGSSKQELVRTEHHSFIQFMADHPLFSLSHFLWCFKQGLKQPFAKFTLFPESCSSHIPADWEMCCYEHPGPAPV